MNSSSKAVYLMPSFADPKRPNSVLSWFDDSIVDDIVNHRTIIVKSR
jgi:hypothetical protein